jgi:hypothetical protein
MRVRFALVLGLIMLTALPAMAVQRMVVVEQFTNSGCPYCGDIKPYMEVILTEEYEGLIVPIMYHGWWPNSGDDFYQFNTAGNEARIDYYAGRPPWGSSLYVPSFRFDGKYIKDPSDVADTTAWNSFIRNTIDSLLTLPSPIRIDVEYNYITPDSDSVYVSFDVVAEEDADINMTLFMVVNEWRHRYPFPTGRHDHAFREFIPSNSGQTVDPMFQGDSLHFEWAYAVDPEYRADRVVTNIIIQRNGTRKIQQGWRGQPEPAAGAGTDVADVSGIRLGRNVPNPFTTETTISYNLRSPGEVRLEVYTLTGRLVRRLVDRNVSPGSHQVVWDGKDDSGADVGSGVYYYRLSGEDAMRQAGKMILLR